MKPLALLLLLAPSLTQALGQTPIPAEPVSAGLFERIAVIGASVSAGYGLSQEVEVEVDLGDLLECCLALPQESVAVSADNFFFTDPHVFGERFLAQVQAREPSLVIALDYLFWFPYGPEASEEERQAELEVGLTHLSRFKCPIVIADLPEISQALSGKGPFGLPLVTAELLPQPATLALLNARIRDWALQRGQVYIVPMADFLHRLRAGEALQIRDNRWPEQSLQRLIQEDLLHPTLEGSLALSLLALDTLAAASETTLPRPPKWELQSVRDELMLRTAAARERVREADRKREERRKARADRKDKDDGGL